MGDKHCLRTFLKKFDYFGVHFNFNYKSKEKYYSATGGIIFILFIIVTIIYIGLNIRPFIQRKNLSIIYYTSKTSQTDEFSLQNYSSTFSLTLTCGALDSSMNILDMLEITLKHVKFIKTDGNQKKEKTTIELEHCTYSSFYNNFNETFDELGLENNFCPKNVSYTLQGLFSDTVFQYYEITLKEKTESQYSQDDILKALTLGECQFSMYFIDVAVDINDYRNPKHLFLNNKFLVLKPDELVKMNFFLKLQKFESDENYLFENLNTKYFIGFSSYQEYQVYKGFDRFKEKPEDYDMFSRIYIRADDQRNIIQRKYMKLTEFAANMSSILSQILLFLLVCVGVINRFYANHSLMKKIFQFKDSEYGTEDKEELKNKLKIIRMQGSENKFNFESEKGLTTRTIQSKKRESSSGFSSPTKSNEFLESRTKFNLGTSNLDFLKQGKTNQLRLQNGNTISKYGKVFQLGKTKKGILETKTQNKERKENKSIPFKYSFCELLVTFTCPCCQWKSLKTKNILLDKAKTKLFFQLDILSYLKNMQLLDLLHYVLLESHENVILHFLSKPSISCANKVDIYDQIRHVNNINKGEINEFYSSVSYLMNKKNKSSIEKRLWYLTKMELSELFEQSNFFSDSTP